MLVYACAVSYVWAGKNECNLCGHNERAALRQWRHTRTTVQLSHPIEGQCQNIASLQHCRKSLPNKAFSCVQNQQAAGHGQQRPYNPSPYLPPPSFPVGNNQSQPTPQQPAVRQNNLHHTTTVRNLVNLKKQSLTLTPRKDDPETLDISFSIDAVQECMYDTPEPYHLLTSLSQCCCSTT